MTLVVTFSLLQTSPKRGNSSVYISSSIYIYMSRVEMCSIRTDLPLPLVMFDLYIEKCLPLSAVCMCAHFIRSFLSYWGQRFFESHTRHPCPPMSNIFSSLYQWPEPKMTFHCYNHTVSFR